MKVLQSFCVFSKRNETSWGTLEIIQPAYFRELNDWFFEYYPSDTATYHTDMNIGEQSINKSHNTCEYSHLVIKLSSDKYFCGQTVKSRELIYFQKTLFWRQVKQITFHFNKFQGKVRLIFA